MNFRPLGKRVLIKRLEEQSTTASGIIIPDNAKEKPSRGTVLAVGTKIKDVSVDDTVVFGKYAGTELAIDGQDYIVMEMSDILGIIK